ncbi:LacI family DNA-binding transcriptional regulator [Georgenia subflava]|uniref:LacI family DNA-binding transcriptional regulator n=1 Tax=Georgenia subflava TaxID=1622177 RepID=A0A6N7EJA6_9MICO|nr:LacI family DNA-binding transcriptional regulator [Georgenia subflava]MPV37511.1 LacI family DNA-binding transcriptional regulator [Georgenia subflava]
MTRPAGDDRAPAPTLVEVARAAGVSRATASRAVNGGDRVSPEALQAVRAAVRELGYRPNRAARALATRRTDSIAVVIPESDSRLFTDPFFATVLHGVTTALASTDLQIVLLIGHKGEQSARMLDYLRDGHTDGAIVVSHHRMDNVAEVLADSPMPSVFIGRPWDPAKTPVTWVDVDNFTGGVLAVEHLVARGARRLGTVAGPQDMGASVDRLAGWRAGAEAAGLATDAVVHADYTVAGATRATEELFAAHPDVDGLFVASDLMASAALRVLETLGRRVPDDVRLVGFDNMELATSLRPALTTLVNPAAEMARHAVEMLLSQFGSSGGTEPDLLATELVVRESS